MQADNRVMMQRSRKEPKSDGSPLFDDLRMGGELRGARNL